MADIEKTFSYTQISMWSIYLVLKQEFYSLLIGIKLLFICLVCPLCMSESTKPKNVVLIIFRLCFESNYNRGLLHKIAFQVYEPE